MGAWYALANLDAARPALSVALGIEVPVVNHEIAGDSFDAELAQSLRCEPELFLDEIGGSAAEGPQVALESPADERATVGEGCAPDEVRSELPERGGGGKQLGNRRRSKSSSAALAQQRHAGFRVGDQQAHASAAQRRML